ncbi:hypothetical protein ACNA6I_02900 [Rossellomorea sp. FS2]|uniref:hypothetical protein n=1 Tax=Rossellomorea sp. FS2 TaxID=3391447 RepID=UPI003A4DA038
MGRIGPIIENGKKAGKLIIKNRKEIIGAITGLSAAGKVIKENIGNKETGKTEEKFHHRKVRYNHYKKILMELDSKNRNELFQYILEVEKFTQQIKNEENRELGVKKPIHKKRIKNWNDILIQIKDKMDTKDYLEFIKIYNNPNYHSEYFQGFEGVVETFKKLNNKQEIVDLIKYIEEITNKGIEQIKKDFSLSE